MFLGQEGQSFWQVTLCFKSESADNRIPDGAHHDRIIQRLVVRELDDNLLVMARHLH